MRRLVASLGAALVVALVQCRSAPTPPEACGVIAPPAKPSDVPDGVVWGFADLHTHPAIELAFGERLIWGTANDDAPVDATTLPDIQACPVETHNKDGPSAVARVVGENVFPRVSALGGFAHGPVGPALGESGAWPNARDVVHQQMNVSSIRRAYEGGLRLMFAAPTDDQALRALLHAPNFDGAFAPDALADVWSADRQLRAIEDLVRRNATWMAIARTPEDARAAIGRGQLAIVLGLELNGLRREDIKPLVDTHHVAHIIPIHLIDNDVGGTAANGDLFNPESAAVSELYRADHEPWQYLELAPTPRYARKTGWPLGVTTLTPAPIYMKPEEVPYARYRELGYEAPALLATCDGPIATSGEAIVLSQENARGLCKDQCLDGVTGAERIKELRAQGLIVDLTHMSRASTADALAVDDRPYIASHSDIAHLCDPDEHGAHGPTPTVACSNGSNPSCADATLAPVSERYLLGAHARALVERGGVLGFPMGTGFFDARAVLAARGGPLFSVAQRGGFACVATPGTPGCAAVTSVEPADPSATVSELAVHTDGGVDAIVRGNAHPFVRVELRDPGAGRAEYARRVRLEPLACTTSACDGTVTLGAPVTVDDIESVTIEWRFAACDFTCLNNAGLDIRARQCASTWDGKSLAPHWRVRGARVTTRPSPAAPPAQLVALGDANAPPIADLGGKRGSLRLWDRSDRPSVGGDVLATGRLLEISMRASPTTALIGASAAQRGANVCVALRLRGAKGACEPAPGQPAADAVACPPGWTRFNQRGEWAQNIPLHAFARLADTSRAVCGVDVAVLDGDPKADAFGVDELRVDAIDDPVGHWVRRYAAAARYVAGGALGTFAFGSDMNGLNGLVDYSENPTPDVPAASICPVKGQLAPSAPSNLSPLRFRHADGTLGDAIRLEERGLATYGLLADFLAAVGAYPGCGQEVRTSLMLSAEATLRAWETILGRHGPSPLPKRAFCCDKPAGVP